MRAVLGYADGFAHAVVVNDQDLIASYLCEDLEARASGIFDAVSRPIEEAVVLEVSPPRSEESMSLTRFSGPGEEVLLRAIWIESRQQLLMRTAQIVERKAR